MRLLAISSHARLGPGTQPPAGPSDAQRRGLLDDLGRLRRLADTLRAGGVVDRAALAGHALEPTWRVLRALLSPDAPARVRKLDPGWYRALIACIERDEARLGAGPRSAGAGDRTAVPLSRFSQVVDAVEWPLDPPPEPTSRPLAGVDPGSDRVWLARAELHAERLVGRGLPPGWAVAWARARPEPTPAGDAVGRVDVRRARRGEAPAEVLLVAVVPRLRAEILLRRAEGGPTGRALDRLATADALALLRPGKGPPRAWVGQLLRLLREAGRAIGRRDWSSVRDDLDRGVSGPDLLAELAWHRVALLELDERGRDGVLSRLPALAEDTPWEVIAGHLPVVISACGPARPPEELARVLAMRCPRPPCRADLELLLGALPSDPAQPGLRVVQAVLRLAEGRPLGADLAGDLLRFVPPGEPGFGIAALRRLTDLFAETCRAGREAEALDRFDPLIRALAGGDGPVEPLLDALARGPIADLLEFEGPAIPPDRLAIAWCALRRADDWAALAQSTTRPAGHVPDHLPPWFEAADGSVDPTDLPAGFWTIARAWLLGRPTADPGREAYLLEVGRRQLDRLRPPGQPSAADRLSRWLRGRHAGESVVRALARRGLDRLARLDDPAARRGALDDLSRACGPGLRPAESDLLAAIVDPRAGADPALAEGRAWAIEALVRPDGPWLAGLTPWLLSALIDDRLDDAAAWIGRLDRLQDGPLGLGQWEAAAGALRVRLRQDACPRGVADILGLLADRRPPSLAAGGPGGPARAALRPGPDDRLDPASALAALDRLQGVRSSAALPAPAAPPSPRPMRWISPDPATPPPPSGRWTWGRAAVVGSLLIALSATAEAWRSSREAGRLRRYVDALGSSVVTDRPRPQAVTARDPADDQSLRVEFQPGESSGAAGDAVLHLRRGKQGATIGLARIPGTRTLLGCTEVTRGQFGLVAPDRARDLDRPEDADVPVTGVTWRDAAAFCKELTSALGRTDEPYRVRLPRVAEWESLAPRAVEGIPESAWLKAPGRGGPRRVPRLGSPHEIVDLIGNVSEWMEDEEDAEGGDVEARRAIRGGSFTHEPAKALKPERLSPEASLNRLGFRVAVEPSR